MLRLYEKKAFGGCKIQILVLNNGLLDEKTELVSLADVAWGLDTI